MRDGSMPAGRGAWWLWLLVAGVAAGGAQAAPPNIVLILADDMGYGDVGVFNATAKVATPNIDRLAVEGLRFTDAHAAASTCTPSRYGLLTGINPTQTGVRNTLLARGRPIIDPNETTLPTVLQKNGYVTRMVGKWHLGFEVPRMESREAQDWSAPLHGGPVDRGFDSWFGIPSSLGASPLCFVEGRSVVEQPASQITYTKQQGGKTVTVRVAASPSCDLATVSPTLCRRAVEAIRDHAAAKEGKPLFLYYASPLPHQPWVPAAPFEGKSGLGAYGDVLMQLDDEVGQIVAALEETGLAANTLLIFTSDNGPGPEAVRCMKEGGHDAAGGLRGQKSDAWEGGHRVPFLVRWPGRVMPGTVADTTITFTDVFATMLDIVGVRPGGALAQQLTDSVSFLPVLEDPARVQNRQPYVHGWYALRAGRWKLVSADRRQDAGTVRRDQCALYDLENDLAEQRDVATERPQVMARLYDDFQAFARQRRLKGE